MRSTKHTNFGEHKMTKVNKFSGFMEVIAVAVLATLPVAVLVVFFYGLFVIIFPSPSCGGEYIGRVGGNPFYGDSCSNQFSRCGNPFNPKSPLNRFGKYGNPYSPYSVTNPYGRG
jgi:hypothetical protein